MNLTRGKRGFNHAAALGGKAMLVVGPFEPPVHGFSKATSEIADLLDRAGFSVTRIDLKPIPGRKSALTSLRVRLRQMTEAVIKIRLGAELYLALSGGRRQAIDLLFLLIGRVWGAKIYLHHHSFAYLSRTSFLANLCFRICGASTTHLVLCGKMKTSLEKRYSAVRRTELVSNSALLGDGLIFRQRTEVRTLGFLGAVTVEKGIFEFLQVAARLATKHPELRFRIAGPCDDDAVLSRLSAACEKSSNLEYVGPVYGEPKSDFFESLDALLFLSTYCNEAEPFVVWEALACGIPVIASARGCMREMLTLEAHQDVVVASHQPLVDLTIQTIEKWLADPETYSRRSTAVYRRYQAASTAALQRFERVFKVPLRTLEVDADLPTVAPLFIQTDKCQVETSIPVLR